VNAVDTNVLVRYLTNDDPIRSPAANALVEKAARDGKPLWVGFGVVLELLWVLGGRYKVPRAVLAETVRQMLLHPAFRLEAGEAVADFCRQASVCRTELDDLLLGLAAKHNGCGAVFTFDRLAARNPLYTSLTPG
jgi:predicted nucleic-acid-binding protein